MKRVVAFRPENNVERCIMLAILADNGFSFDDTRGLFTQDGFSTYPIILKNNVKKVLNVIREGDLKEVQVVSKKEFMNTSEPPRVPLNKDYTAVLWDECIVVGCQEIPYENLKALYNAAAGGYLPQGPTRHPRQGE